MTNLMREDQNAVSVYVAQLHYPYEGDELLDICNTVDKAKAVCQSRENELQINQGYPVYPLEWVNDGVESWKATQEDSTVYYTVTRWDVELDEGQQP